MKRDQDEERTNMHLILEERRRRKADRMQIRKLRIEHDQLDDILKKELHMNDLRFKRQV
jgi:hypothetical protein